MQGLKMAVLFRVLCLFICSNIRVISAEKLEYILKLNTDLTCDGDVLNDLEQRFHVEVTRLAEMGRLRMLCVRGSPDDVIGLSELPEVDSVEQKGCADVTDPCAEKPSPGTWGLDRIDQRARLPYTDPQSPDATYIWGQSLGSQTVAYVADTGVDLDHVEFEGRAIWGYTAEGITEPETDLNGHGTHCAGIIGSRSYGVAKGVIIKAVKVLSELGYGTWSDVIDGLVWILEDHQQREELSGSAVRSVVLMALGGSGSNLPLEDTIQQLYDAGVPVVVVAGGNAADACEFTPARAPNATTVASCDVTDGPASSSNWGTCLDLFAPGVSVLSTTPGNNTDEYSGTSMAAAFVVGVVARYQSSLSSAPSAGQVADWLASTATAGALILPPEHGTSPNLLLYVDCTS